MPMLRIGTAAGGVARTKGIARQHNEEGREEIRGENCFKIRVTGQDGSGFRRRRVKVNPDSAALLDRFVVGVDEVDRLGVRVACAYAFVGDPGHGGPIVAEAGRRRRGRRR
eukprot:4169456-Pyramimonas_sp.AAC.1